MSMDEEDRKLLKGIAVNAEKAATSAARADASASIAVQQGLGLAARIGAVEGRLGNLEMNASTLDQRVSRNEQEIQAGVHQAPSDRDSVILPIAPGNDDAEHIAMDRSSGDLGIVVDVGAPESAPLPPMRKPAASITTEVQRTRASVRAVALDTKTVVAQNEHQTTMLQGITTGIQKSPMLTGAATSGGVVVGMFLIAVFNTLLQSCATGHSPLSRQPSTAPAPMFAVPSIPSAPAPAGSLRPDAPPVPVQK